MRTSQGLSGWRRTVARITRGWRLGYRYKYNIHACTTSRTPFLFLAPYLAMYNTTTTYLKTHCHLPGVFELLLYQPCNCSVTFQDLHEYKAERKGAATKISTPELSSVVNSGILKGYGIR